MALALGTLWPQPFGHPHEMLFGFAAALVCAAGIALPTMAAEQHTPGGRAVTLDEAVERALAVAPALKARETRV